MPSPVMQGRDPASVHDDAQIINFFVDDYIDQRIETPTKRTFIFVDAADSCGTPLSGGAALPPLAAGGELGLQHLRGERRAPQRRPGQRHPRS